MDDLLPYEDTVAFSSHFLADNAEDDEFLYNLDDTEEINDDTLSKYSSDNRSSPVLLHYPNSSYALFSSNCIAILF